MAFGLQSWNPGGVSLNYRPQTLALPSWGSDLSAGGMARPTTGGGFPPETVKPAFGMWDPKMKKLPTLGPNADAVQGLDALLKTTGMFLSQPGALAEGVDPSAYAALAKGQGAGTGKAKKFNESALAALLSLGAGGMPAEGKPRKKGKGVAVPGLSLGGIFM